MTQQCLGIIGGTGWQGGAIARQLLRKGFIAPENLYLSNQSGRRQGFEQWKEVHISNNNQSVINNCSTIILSVRPHQLADLSLNLANHLVISIMAGTAIEQIQQLTGAMHIIRSMPNAAAEIGEAYTPWVATTAVTVAEKQQVKALFAAFGLEDEVASEDQINYFTALTGSGPGLLAYYQQCMIDAAVAQGVQTSVAEHAIKQLFKGAGSLYAKDKRSIHDIVKEFVDYAGTTAAGILQMQSAGLAAAIESGIDTAYQKASSDMTKNKLNVRHRGRYIAETVLSFPSD
jgi:pyrroline-5-carboxylate reductase